MAAIDTHFEVVGRSGTTGIAGDALIIDVEFSVCIFWVFIRYICHGTQFSLFKELLQQRFVSGPHP